MPVKILDHIAVGECATVVTAPCGQTGLYAKKTGFDTLGQADNFTPPPLVGEHRHAQT